MRQNKNSIEFEVWCGNNASSMNAVIGKAVFTLQHESEPSENFIADIISSLGLKIGEVKIDVSEWLF